MNSNYSAAQVRNPALFLWTALTMLPFGKSRCERAWLGNAVARPPQQTVWRRRPWHQLLLNAPAERR